MGAQEGHDEFGRLRVEAGEGIVDDDDVGVGGQGGGDVDAGDLGAAEVLQRSVAAVGELEAREQGEGVALGRTEGDAVETGEVDDLVDDPHVRVAAALTGQVAEVLPVAKVELVALDFDGALIGADETHDHTHEFGASCRSGADDGGDPTCLGGEAHLVQICSLPLAEGDLVECEHTSSLRSSVGGRAEPRPRESFSSIVVNRPRRFKPGQGFRRN